MVINPTEGDVRNKLVTIMTGGCTCLTKTHETKYHLTDCHYRLASEVYSLLAEQANAVPVAWFIDEIDGDFVDREYNAIDEFSCGRKGGTPLYLHPSKDTNPLNHPTQDLYEHWLAVENLYHTEDLRKAFYHGAGEHTPEELAGFRDNKITSC